MNKRLMIGIPINRELSPKFVLSLMAANHFLICGGYIVEINFNDGTTLCAQRNKIINEAVKAEMNLLFIDSDMVFDSNAVETVLQNESKGDLIGGLCYMRRIPFRPAVFGEDRIKTDCCFTGIRQRNIPVYPFKCAAVGCAFLLIKLDTMQKILQVYDRPFNHITMINGDMLGEDLSFMHRCNKLGLKIVCVPNVDIGHLSTVSIGRKEHMNAIEKIKWANAEHQKGMGQFENAR